MNQLTTLLCAASLTLAVACKKDEAAAPKAADKPAPAAKTSYKCSLQLAKKGAPTFVGDANGPDEKQVADAAWAVACDKIPEAERGGCKDEGKFTRMIGGGALESGGKKTYSTTITLTQVMPSFAGKGASESSEDEACKAAVAEACKAAGAPAGADCSVGGEWEQKNLAKSSTKSL